MDLENNNIKSKKEFDQFVTSLSENPNNLENLLDYFYSEYLEIKATFDLFMEIYNETELNDEIEFILRELIFKFYTSYNTIESIGNTKTRIYGNRQILDDNSIAAILRIMLEIKLKIVFIFENLIENYNTTKFRFYIWKYCDLKNSQNHLINYEKIENHDQELTEIYSFIKAHDEFKKLSKESIKSIKKGNWAKFHNGFLYPNSVANNSILASFWYSHFSTFIHTTFTSLKNRKILIREKSSSENMKIYYGMASFIGKEILVFLNSIKNETLIKTNLTYKLNLDDKFKIWNHEIENNRIFESELREN